MKKSLNLLCCSILFTMMLFSSIEAESDEELCYMPASELLRRFTALELSPVDVLEAQIKQIEAENININAVTERHYEEAFAQAKESELRYQNGNPRSLEGLTCAIKDDTEVKGWRSAMGSLIRKEAPLAKADSALATLLREAGVVMHIQTNVPEYYCNLVTWNRLYGVCRNPWNLVYTPGGSSGGASAALAAGFTTLATGSDMGGSIRFPAAMTALYGFKPPYGRVATSLTQYESAGPMARTFEDLNLFQNAIAGPSPLMISSLKPKMVYPEEYGDIKGWKIAYDPMDHWGIPVDKTIVNGMLEAVKVLQSLGAHVEQVDLGFRAKDFDAYALGIFSTSIGPFCFNAAQKNPELSTPYLLALIEEYANKISPQHLEEAEDLICVRHNQIQQLVFSQGYQAIIMPTMCTPYVAADMGTSPENTFVLINDEAYSAKNWNYSFTWPWNMLGQYPVINVPIGLTPEGIPMGMQIIGNTYDDLTVFQIASEWSKVTPNYY